MEFQVVQVLFLLTATNAIDEENPTERHAKATRKAERSLRTTRDGDKKSEQQREEKKTGRHREINAMTKGTKGTRKEQTKRKREERTHKRAAKGGGGEGEEKKSAVMSARG